MTMSEEIPPEIDELKQYHTYESQRCFVGYSNGARWSDDILSTCKEVLPQFGLEPWDALNYLEPTKSLLDNVVEMIANARYGIYDLSYWQKENKEWVMPRNVFIELGIAIALNRPTLLLHHKESQYYGPKLPACLSSISDHIVSFTGGDTLKEALEQQVPQWVDVPPDRDWRNRYCLFGNRMCAYRELHPSIRYHGQEKLHCHISDGKDLDQRDFRNGVKHVLEPYNNLSTNFLDGLSIVNGYSFLLCTFCQEVRSAPFAIYRITPETTGETFMAIGMSIALETQFKCKIPKIFLTRDRQDVPSLLSGYKLVVAQSHHETKKQLRKFLPMIISGIRKTTWRANPLPFIEYIPIQPDKPITYSNKLDEPVNDEEKDSFDEIEASTEDNDPEKQSNSNFEEMGEFNEMAELLLESASPITIKRGDIVEGVIVRIDLDEILVDIGLQSVGVLSTKELLSSGYGSFSELHIDDKVLVYVIQPETQEGHALLSLKRAHAERQWRIAEQQFRDGEVIKARVIDYNKGGLIVNVSGIRGFVPISQILNLKREEVASGGDNQEMAAKLQSLKDKELQLKIIEVNRARNRLFLSERLAVQEWRLRRREELLDELRPGEIRGGVVSNLANFGAFVDLGGADGLVHISQLAWSHVNHPSEVLHVGQEVSVQVLSVDKEKKKIALSIKRAEVDPWTTMEQRYTPGQVVTGVITKIAPYGAFARIEDGIEGLIHLSEFTPSMDPNATLHEGMQLQLRILRIETDRRRLGLSLRQTDELDIEPLTESSTAKHRVTDIPDGNEQAKPTATTRTRTTAC